MSIEACAPVSSGSGFLSSTLAYLDCAGQATGSAGYTALSQPGTIVSQLLLTAVTIFIAGHGIRMMFGRMPAMGDVVLAVAKIGIVLMLVTSWPAVRTLFAAPAFAGPTELVAQTGLATPALEDRLQQVDDGIVALTRWGSGKLDIRAGATAEGQPAATEFSGIALTDSLALGFGRLSYLVGVIISFGLLKLLLGVLISALPIFAGLLLFDASRSLFFGWLRMVFALFVASFAIPLLLTAELNLIEPWLAEAIQERSANFATPSAPTELLAISGSFLLILSGSIALIVRACFAVDFSRIVERIPAWHSNLAHDPDQRRIFEQAMSPARTTELTRAETLALTLSRLDQSTRGSPTIMEASARRISDGDTTQPDVGRTPSGSTGRRARQRPTLSHSRRNQI